MRRALLALGAALCLAAPAEAQQVYRWVDAQGNVHYTQTPPPDQTPPPAVAPPAAEEPAKAAPAPVPRAAPVPKAAPAPAPKAVPPAAKAAAQPAAPSRPVASTPADDAVDRARILLDKWTGRPEHLKQAQAELKSVLDKDPKNARALTQLARFTYKAGYSSGDNYDAEALRHAAQLVGQALTTDPKLAEAHVVRGYVLLFQKDPAGARRAGLEAERLSPSDFDAALLLSDIALREKSLDEAAQRATKAIDVATESRQKARAYSALARAQRQRKDLKAAEDAYVAAIRHDPESAWARVNYAQFLSADVGDQDRAISAAKDGLRLMDFGVGHRALSRAAYRKAAKLAWTDKNWDAAGMYFEMATEHDPTYANAHYGLGMYYWVKAEQAKDKKLIDRAGLRFQTALKVEPDHKEARRALDDLASRGWKLPAKPPATKK